MKFGITWFVAATAALSVGVLFSGASPASAAGCAAEMQSTTPMHSIYDPGAAFGQDVAFTAHGGYSEFGIDGVNDYVAFIKGDCAGSD